MLVLVLVSAFAVGVVIGLCLRISVSSRAHVGADADVDLLQMLALNPSCDGPNQYSTVWPYGGRVCTGARSNSLACVMLVVIPCALKLWATVGQTQIF